MARRISDFTTNSNQEIPEGDERYLAQELLCFNQNKHGMIDLKKADVFALGCTAYELIEGISMPKNGQGYHDLRQGRVVFNKYTQERFSQKLRDTVRLMLSPIPQDRPSIEQILDMISSAETRH